MSRHTAIHNTLGKALGNNLRRMAHIATHGPAQSPYHNLPYQGEGHTHRAIDTAIAAELLSIELALSDLTPLIVAEANVPETPDSRQRVLWLLSLRGAHAMFATWLRGNCPGCHADIAEPTPLAAYDDGLGYPTNTNGPAAQTGGYNRDSNGR